MRAQLIITREGQKKSEAEPEFGGEPGSFEVGVPRGRLQTKGPAGETHYLRLFTGEESAFSPDVYIPTTVEVDNGARWLEVPGLDGTNKRMDWHLFADEAVIEDFRSFVQELRNAGCSVVEVPPG